MYLCSRIKVGFVFSQLVIVCLVLFGSTKLVTFAASQQLNSSSTKVGVPSITSSVNCGTWNIIPSPSLGVQDYLYRVAALSVKSAWTVGMYSIQSTGQEKTLIEHWNGSNWIVVSSPSPGTQGSTLYGVTALSAKNVWAVGTSYSDVSTEQTLIEHWDGTSWNTVPSPNPNSINELSDVVRVSPTSQLWAVGYTRQGGAVQQTLIEHWNANTWSVVNSPNPSTSGNGLNGIAAISATNIWAVGSYYNTNDNAFQNLIEQWNGANWNTATNPSPGWFSMLQDVKRVPGTDQLWTVGEYIPTQGANQQTLIEFYC